MQFFYYWLAETVRVVVVVLVIIAVLESSALVGAGKTLEKETKICTKNFTKAIESVKNLKSRWWLYTNSNKAY